MKELELPQTLRDLQVTRFRKGQYLQLIKEELNVKEVKLSEGELGVDLDTEITPELKLEGLSRELIRKLNNLRKKEGLTIQDKIILYFSTEDKEMLESFSKFEDDIKHSVQAEKVVKEKVSAIEFKEIIIDKRNVFVAIRKL